MKSPDELKKKLTRQWQQANYRHARLLNADQWPLVLTISKPSFSDMTQQSAKVKQHIKRWQQITIGQVIWQPVFYRGLQEPVAMPVAWQLNKPSEWANATDNPEVKAEFLLLDDVLAAAEEKFRALLILKRPLWRGKAVEDIKNCLKLAALLEPGAAQGKPLRAMAGLEVDSKFFERNETLLVALLDERFQGEVKKLGLIDFLNAQSEADHWLLVVPLQKDLLPFPRLRLSTQQLADQELPAKTIVVIENERCEHLLPEIDGAIAILGAGLDLSWLASSKLQAKQLIYWGDIDTWGFKMLAAARELKPDLQSVLMDRPTFNSLKENSAVAEPVTADHVAFEHLTDAEQTLYKEIKGLAKGRLEQEFIPASQVAKAISAACLIE